MKIRVRGAIIPKNDVLDDPEAYRDKDIMCFEVKSKSKLVEYFKKANRERQTLTLTDWSKDPTKAQQGMFFELRDRLAEMWSPGRLISKIEKDEVYRTVVQAMDLTVDSIKDMDSKELSGTIDMMKDWLTGADVDITDLR